jgi:hypothetical protein
VRIYPFGAADLGFAASGMPDHVTVGKIGHDQIKLLVNRLHHLPRHLFQTQLWNLVKGDPAGRGNANVGFARVGLVVAAVQEVGHMGKFF